MAFSVIELKLAEGILLKFCWKIREATAQSATPLRSLPLRFLREEDTREAGEARRKYPLIAIQLGWRQTSSRRSLPGAGVDDY
jgi:hypothetical protein